MKDLDLFWPVIIAICLIILWGHDTYNKPYNECINNLAKFCPNLTPEDIGL